MEATSELSLSNITRWLLCVLIVTLIITPLFAQTPEKALRIVGSTDPTQPVASIQGTRWALLVGIWNYPEVDGFEVSRLKAPAKDVDALYAFLTDPQKGNFPREQVFVLKDDKATRDEILITFNDIARKAATDDLVLFYFSGHGYWMKGDDQRIDYTKTSAYLLPYFTNSRAMSDPKTTCIDFDDLAEKIRTMEANKVVVILDACHAGGVKPLGSKDAPTNIYHRFVEAFHEAKGRPLLLSSDESEVSWETPQGSVFTQFLLKGLEGAADTNGDGIIGFTEVAEYVEKEVPIYTRLNFPKTQTPTRRYEHGSIRLDIPMAINAQANAAFRQKHQDLLDSRTGAILRASLAGLDQVLKEFSLQVAQSAYHKALSSEDLTEKEKLLLAEMDALQNRTLAVADYIVRARAIYNLPEGLGTSLTQLRVEVAPDDATVTLTPANATNRVIPPFSPNAYRVEKGRYRIFAQRAGYAPDSRELVLNQGTEAVTVILERLMGTLDIQVTPTDATVTVTSIDVPAPVAEIGKVKDLRLQSTSGRKLPIGTYRVTAEKEGYKPAVREPVEITANASTRVKLALSLKPAIISASNLPIGARVFVNNVSVTLPFELSPGTHKIRLERDGFQPVEMSEALKPGHALALSPNWIPITPPTTSTQPPTKQSAPSISPKGIPRDGAFAASLVVPGLGQHLQGHHVRGLVYEVATISVGVAALWATNRHQSTLEEYLSSPDIDYYYKAISARKLAIATQIVFGVVWGIQALDAAITKPLSERRRVALEILPASNNGRVVVRVQF